MNHVEVLWMNGACALYCGSTTLRLGSSEKPKGIYHDRPSVLPEVLLMDGKSWSRITYKKSATFFLNFRAKNGRKRKIYFVCTILYLFVPFCTFLYLFVPFYTFLYLFVPFLYLFCTSFVPLLYLFVPFCTFSYQVVPLCTLILPFCTFWYFLYLDVPCHTFFGTFLYLFCTFGVFMPCHNPLLASKMFLFSGQNIDFWNSVYF